MLIQNQQTVVSVPLTISPNSAESDLLSQINSEKVIPDNVRPATSSQLAEVAKRYWVEESRKVPVVAKIVEKLKMASNWNFVKVPKLNEEIAYNKKILPTTNGQTKDWQKFRSQQVWQPLQYCKCLMQPFNISSNPLN